MSPANGESCLSMSSFSGQAPLNHQSMPDLCINPPEVLAQRYRFRGRLAERKWDFVKPWLHIVKYAGRGGSYCNFTLNLLFICLFVNINNILSVRGWLSLLRVWLSISAWVFTSESPVQARVGLHAGHGAYLNTNKQYSLVFVVVFSDSIIYLYNFCKVHYFILTTLQMRKHDERYDI